MMTTRRPLRANRRTMPAASMVGLAMAAQLGLCATAHAAPANDARTQAAPILTVPFSDERNTTGATLEPGESRPCGQIGATVWYRYTPAANAILTADTFGSDFDTVVAVYRGSPLYTGIPLLDALLEPLTPIACNDDTNTGLQSSVTFTATTGATYYLQVGGYAGASGNLALQVAPRYGASLNAPPSAAFALLLGLGVGVLLLPGRREGS